MCAMALLHRAKALCKRRRHEGKASGHEAGLVPAEECMPASFIGEALRAGRSSVKLACSANAECHCVSPYQVSGSIQPQCAICTAVLCLSL